MIDPKSILEFWFADACESPATCSARDGIWFGSDKQLDEAIFEHYSDTVIDAGGGHFDFWADDTRGRLALIILLDQFPRNIYRGTAEVFRYDGKALTLAREGMATGQLDELAVPEQAFMLMPFQHAEDLAAQDEGLERYSAMAQAAPPEWREKALGYRDFSALHRDIISSFGRFPHRNAVLGRKPTEAETRYLAEGGATFGQGS